MNPGTYPRAVGESDAKRRLPTSDGSRDRGSSLILVLVLMVVGSLLVIPVMQYAMSIIRANTVLSEKTQRLEAVKGGFRIALANPVDLYHLCGEAGETTAVDLAGARITGFDVASRCYYVDYAATDSSDALRIGLTTTAVGSTIPVELTGTRYESTTTTGWLDLTSTESLTDRIWLPNLPEHGISLRSPNGHSMPAGFETCKVYFPGRFVDPVVLNGPTYFVSGVYYFEGDVRVEGGASVVAGGGSALGCTTDQEAAFYAVDAPSTHNISGLGATWVFGGEARLTITNSTGPVSMVFNNRYVAPGDFGGAPAAGVSIMTVNGGPEPGTPLVVPGVVEVPASLVGSVDPVPAGQRGYAPSALVPAPALPEPPVGVTARAHPGALVVSWSGAGSGASAQSYTATVTPGGMACSTDGSTACTITGLDPAQAYTATVTAATTEGTSEPSAPSAAVTPATTAPALLPPSSPVSPSATPYEGAARVTWTAGSGSNRAPAAGYVVTAQPGGAQCTTQGATSCVVTGLDPAYAAGYRFSVLATSAVGDSSAVNTAAAVRPALGLGSPPDPAASAAAVPVVDIDVPGPSDVSLTVPGYVAIPQGSFRLNNPQGHQVGTTGGILAAAFDVIDIRSGMPAQPESVPIGYLESIVQRTFRIVTTLAGGAEVSTAVVQVNQNGAYAVNSWVVG
jgi:hypothetical protein